MIDPDIFDEANSDIGPMQMLSYAIGYLVVAAVVAGLAYWPQSC